jgi:hypothetical protein
VRACLTSGGSAQWAYCPLCGLFAMEAAPGLSGQARQRVEAALRSFVKMAVQQDQAAACADG